MNNEYYNFIGGKPETKATAGESKPLIDREIYVRAQNKLYEDKDSNRYVPPLGYKQQGDKLVVNEEEADVVKRALDEMAQDGRLSPDTEQDLRRLWKQHYTKK